MDKEQYKRLCNYWGGDFQKKQLRGENSYTGGVKRENHESSG